MDIERLKVDESLWPEGATHWCGHLFYRVTSDAVLFLCGGLEWRNSDAYRLGEIEMKDMIPRPEPRQVGADDDLPKMAIMVNPHEAPLQYGEEHLGREIEVIEWLPDESCYVVRFDWGLGVLHDSMVDFGLYGARTKERREEDELMALLSDYMFDVGDDCEKAPKAIIAAGWRKTDES